jgi:hypothetical protein
MKETIYIAPKGFGETDKEILESGGWLCTDNARLLGALLGYAYKNLDSITIPNSVFEEERINRLMRLVPKKDGYLLEFYDKDDPRSPLTQI